jgi:hypothetical protein
MSGDDQPLGDQLRQLTNHMKGLAALQTEVFDAFRRFQDVWLFDGHPELVDLDDELDNLYPDAQP